MCMTNINDHRNPIDLVFADCDEAGFLVGFSEKCALMASGNIGIAWCARGGVQINLTCLCQAF